MAHSFGQVLGGVLSAIAEARCVSDQASRELARLYEKDDLMRLFPVPRVDLESVEVELRFAPDQSIAPTNDPAIERLMEQTVQAVRKVVREGVVADRQLNDLIDVREHWNKKREAYLEHLGVLCEQVVREVIFEPTRLVASEALEVGVTVEAFDARRVAMKLIEALRPEVIFKKDDGTILSFMARLLEPVARSHNDEAVKLGQRNARVPFRVLFMHQDLMNVDEHVLSSLKLTVHVHNYNWTKTGEENGQPIRTLVPE